ncbi:MAG TPA: hypothetical protein PLM81_11575 [Ginsengibacter sp.]|nr:hypothetical protein [Chitinophagaceae bacterium]MCW5913330.1 hypothetical protein [Chitinophagaceae bacterium]HRN73761.1 hypothetical protein [Ginsengibacter sp.]HRP18150.1 hypothetical protein [Ginsengibacter sp.]HRP44630.1 hypothetical protein [Ginsengibacter sp.]
MSTIETIVIILLLVLILCFAWALTEINSLKKLMKEKPRTSDSDTLKLRLQAYERLSVLTERISFQNLVTRIPNAGLSSREMQGALIENIKQEYEYNVSQQIYVLPDIWKAVNNLKEQNIYIINQLASSLPPHASAMDLSKQIVDFTIRNPKATLSNLVHDAINYEAQKLM